MTEQSIFGPYTNVTMAKEMIEFIKSKFKIRQCKNFKSQKNGCLNYHIQRCLAPCMSKISKKEYRKIINQIIDLLDGKVDKLIKELNNEINTASINLEYEKAAYLRDKKIAIERIIEKQKVSNISENDIDVIGLAKKHNLICIEIFFIRKSKLIDRKHYIFEDLQDVLNAEIISSFIKQYYLNNTYFPNKIMIKENIEEKELLQNLFTQKANRKVEICNTQRGEKLKLVEMAEKNAQIVLENRLKETYNIINELKEVLNLNKLPNKIEAFDISNIFGEFIVAGMSVLKNGKVNKKLNRRFKIKTVLQQNDVKCMEEVIMRRLKHSIGTTNTGFGELPDVIFVDGGISQIRAAQKAVKIYDLNIPIFGMVKNNKHNTQMLIDENQNEIVLSEELFNIITNLQNTVHNTAIEYHKKIRDKRITNSKLDDIEGIGKQRKIMLLKAFGSVTNIREASIEEISSIKGINKELAQKIKENLK